MKEKNLLGVVLALGLVACGGSPGEGAASEESGTGGTSMGGAASGGAATGGNTATGGANSISADTEMEACVRYIEAACEKQAACDPKRRDACLGLRGECPSRMFAEGTKWTIESAVACAAEWEKLSCEDVVRGAQPSCFVTGEFLTGEDCFSNSQCASGWCSATPSADVLCGACVEPQATGSPCSTSPSSKELCDTGDDCDEVGDSIYQCAPSVAKPGNIPVGEAGVCGRLGPYCGEGLGCEIEKPTNDWEEPDTGKCAPLPKVGDPCLPTFDSSGACAVGATCNSSRNGTCIAEPEAGEGCGWAQCDPHAYCDYSGETYLCVARSAAGEPCTGSIFNVTTDRCDAGLECLCVDLFCGSAVCATPREEGESCNETSEICRRHLECADGICSLPAAPQDWWSAVRNSCN